MTSKSETNLHEYMCEYGWLIYCHDDDDVLHVHCVYKTEEEARKFLKETPYFNFCSPSDRDNCIKFKLKRVEIKTIG
jgi:hypothetical protein